MNPGSLINFKFGTSSSSFVNLSISHNSVDVNVYLIDILLKMQQVQGATIEIPQRKNEKSSKFHKIS